MGENHEDRDIAGVLTKGVAPALGMAMVWPLLRYASFFRLLYPAGLDVPFGEGGFSAHGVFLATLALVAVAALVLWYRAPRAFAHRGVMALLGSLASLGALLALAMEEGALPPWALWVSIAITAVGFLALYLGWGSYMAGLVSGGEAPRAVVLLGVSFALGFVLFSRAGLVGSFAQGRIAALIMPVGASVLWYCSRPCAELGGGVERSAPHRAVTPLLAAVGAFLVVGSAVRGIVDLEFQGVPGRQFSMEASLLVAAVAIGAVAWRERAIKRRQRVRSQSDGVALLAIGYWMAFALMFMGGLFAFLATDSKRAGGDVVVVSRTLMEFVFWLLLCHAVAVRRVPAVPVFLVCGVLVEVVSWTVSYGFIPVLAGSPATSVVLKDNSFVLAVVLGAVAVALVAMGVRWAFGKPADLAVAARSKGPLPGEGVRTVAAVPMGDAAGEGLLTERETTVARLYARGYTLRKVADELHITKSTAQSHIKHVYRKLGVHSRDELIELLDDGRQG